MAKNLLETDLPPNELHESLVLTPISNNDLSAVELPVENDGVCNAENENVSRICSFSCWIAFLKRLVWFPSFIIGIIICFVAALLIEDIWMKYYNNHIVVTFDPFETTIDEIPFPAVTICNTNKVLKTKAEQLIEAQKIGTEKTGRSMNEIFQTEAPVYYLDQICSSSRSFSEKFNNSLTTPLLNISYTPLVGNLSLLDLEKIMKDLNISDYEHLHRNFTQFLLDNTQNCEDMILRCVWRDKVQNCNELFKRNEASEFGTCCTFNMVPEDLLHIYEDSEGEKYTEGMARWSHMNLIIDDLFNFDSEEKKYLKRQYTPGRSFGLSIEIDPSLSEYFCTDSDSQGFLLQTHLPIDAPHVQDFGIAIKPNTEAFISIKPKITLAHPEIRSDLMDQRKCYFHGEFILAYYRYYTKSNCVDECVANETYSSCNCVPFYMARDKNRFICDLSKLECAKAKRKEILKDGIKIKCSYCHPTCSEIEYLDELTSAPLQTSVNSMGNNDTEDDILNGTRNNLSIVHIYFGEESTYLRLRTKEFGIADVIVNLCGLMGLCLGFSGRSLIECLYYFTLRAWCHTPQR